MPKLVFSIAASYSKMWWIKHWELHLQITKSHFILMKHKQKECCGQTENMQLAVMSHRRQLTNYFFK